MPGQDAAVAMRPAVIGLGVMGSAFARHLVSAGYKVAGFDTDRARLETCEKDGIDVAVDCSRAVHDADVVLCSLPDASALESTVTVLLELPSRKRTGLVVAELSTLGLDCKLREMRRLAEGGITMLDCPVSGTGAQAETGEVIVYASGVRDAVASVRPVLSGFSRKCLYLGDFGNGTRMKLIANLLVAIHNVATAEALSLAEKSGIDATAFCEVIGAGGAATSRVLELRAPLMASGEYTPATMRLDLWQKDMTLISEFARNENAATPLFSTTEAFYRRAVEQGLGALDTAAVYEVVKALSRAGESTE